MESDFGRFIAGLQTAGSRMDAHYFRIIVYGAREPIYRERVYCYELYHQLRVALGDDFEYKLDGELDKIKHPALLRLVASKPDLLVHVPGEMTRNLAVVEVKPVDTRVDRLHDDLLKLKGFLDYAQYFRGIMLVYSNVRQEIPDWIREQVHQFQEPRIALVWHVLGESPQVVNVGHEL
jgi:hypothetical protein